jgi:UPF0716 protein FxsA
VALLVLLFIVVPVVELYLIIQVGGAIGVIPTLAILIGDALLGSFLLRHQGRAAWVRFNRALAENRIPTREVLDGVLVIFGGAFLLTPGFLTDIVGLVLLIPPTRALVRGGLGRVMKGRLSVGTRSASWGYTRMRSRRADRGPAPGWPPPGPPRSGGRRPGDIEGTAHELSDEDELERGGPER